MSLQCLSQKRGKSGYDFYLQSGGEAWKGTVFILYGSQSCAFKSKTGVQVRLVGKEHLVLDLSCRKKGDKYFVVTDRWQKFSNLEVNEATLAQLASSCDEFLVHGVDVEGMGLGVDRELVQILGESSPIPVTYAGGARTLVSLQDRPRFLWESCCLPGPCLLGRVAQSEAQDHRLTHGLLNLSVFLFASSAAEDLWHTQGALNRQITFKERRSVSSWSQGIDKSRSSVSRSLKERAGWSFVRNA